MYPWGKKCLTAVWLFAILTINRFYFFHNECSATSIRPAEGYRLQREVNADTVWYQITKRRRFRGTELKNPVAILNTNCVSVDDTTRIL